jgi:hypothetical protein
MVVVPSSSRFWVTSPIASLQLSPIYGHKNVADEDLLTFVFALDALGIWDG